MKIMLEIPEEEPMFSPIRTVALALKKAYEAAKSGKAPAGR